jgi:[ribosomal protein S18]-alanine N-acetyltransferase
MLIRAATPADIPRMRELEQQSDTAAHWAGREYDALFAPEAPGRVALIAGNDNGIQAFLIARCGLDEWEIENVVVDSGLRSGGIGAALVRRLVDLARTIGIPAILLEVRESNLPARRLYEKIGFTQGGRRTDYYDHPVEDALLLRFSVSDV